MKFWSHTHVCLIVLLSLSLRAHGTEDDFKKEAVRAFPITHSIPSLTDLKTAFQPIMHPDTAEQFNTYFGIMFREDFPKPVHPIAAIIGGFRCLYVKMLTANARGNEQMRKELQLTALHQLLALHKDPIAQFDEILASKITGFGCPSCKDSAKAALGFEGEHSGYQELR